MSHKENGGSPEINNNKTSQQTPKKPKTSLINKLFKRKKPTKANVTSSSSTDSESEDQSKHYRFFSKRKSKRKSTGVKNVTEKFDHVVISPERKVQLSPHTSPYQVRQINARLKQETISADNTHQSQEHLYINTTDIQPWSPHHNSNVSRDDILRGIANEQEYLRRLKMSQRRIPNEVIHKKSNDVNSSVKRSNSGRGVRKDVPMMDPNSQVARFEFNKRNRSSQSPHRTNEVLQSINNRMHYRSDDNISRTYENSAMFDHLNGNLSSPSARRSRKHLSDDDNISLRRRTETNSSNENLHTNSLSRRTRAARNERYYKRLSRDHEMEKLVLPLSPKNKHKVLQQTNSLPIAAPNATTKNNYAPRYPNFQKINQPYYNMNSTYPIPQSVGNSSRVSSSSSLNRTVNVPNPPRNAVVPRSRLSSSSTSSYPQNSTYPPQQNPNLSRMSSSSTLSHATNPNYPTFPPTDMRLVHGIPYKSVSYESNINNNASRPVSTRDVKSMSFDNINQHHGSGPRKIPPCPPPRNPNRKTIAIYEAPNSIVQSNQKRYSSHHPYDYNTDSSNLYQNDGISRTPYNEAYTGERAYLIKQAYPNHVIYTSNPSENFIRNEMSQYNVKPVPAEELIQQTPIRNQPNQTYFHHKDNSQIGSDGFSPDSRYTNNDRLNEPNQYGPNMENTNVQFYSATSKIISASPKVSPNQNGYHTGEQLYENTSNIRAHQNTSQQSKRSSSISPTNIQCYKRSFVDQNFPNSQILLQNQRLTRSNETLPYDENISRMNEIGIPVQEGSNYNPHKGKVSAIKRPMKGRQSLEIKETVRPLSIVLEKSENELDSDRTNNTNTSNNGVKSKENSNTKSRKLNENGLRITREGKNFIGSASNLDDALTELEQIYESLNLNDEDLLDRAERRDLPICYQMNKDQYRDTPEVEEINRILGNSNNPNKKASARRIAIPNKINDDMALRKYRYQQKDNTVNQNNSETGSYLLTSPTLSPPPFFEDTSASPVALVDAEPDVTRDDVVYRSTKYVNNLLKVHEPQPFGIPVRPVVNSSSTDYLHITPDNEKYRSTFHNSKTPDVVMDDLAYRNLRKDYNKYCNTLMNFNLIPAFRSDRDRISSPLSEKDKYLSNLNDTERFQKRKKRAMRSLSGNLFMRDYHANESDPIVHDFLRVNGHSNIVRSETTSPDYQSNKCPILESDFEKLKDRWLCTPSPEDMERQKNRDRSLINYINKNSNANKKVDNIVRNNNDQLLKEPNEELNISSEVENLRKKFVIPNSNGKEPVDKSNPFKKMLSDDFDISPEVNNIRKKFIANKSKKDNFKPKTFEEVDFKNNFNNIKNQIDSSPCKTNGNGWLGEKSIDSSKNNSMKSPKINNTDKENPFVSKFENIRKMFLEKNDVEEVKEIIKPKKKIKKFRESNNNSVVTANDYYDYKSNMDRTIDTLKKRNQSEDFNNSKSEDTQEETSVSDTSQSDNQKDKNASSQSADFISETISEQISEEKSNPLSREDELLEILAKETTETSEQINKKLKQLTTTVVQHKSIKLNQFPITLDDDNAITKKIENSEGDRKMNKHSILKSVQTVSMESEYDNIPKSTDDPDRLQTETNHEEVPNFDDLDIPHETNIYEKLDFNNFMKVGNIVQQFEKGHCSEDKTIRESSKSERKRTGDNESNRYSKQTSISSEYDNVPFRNDGVKNQDHNVFENNQSTFNKNKEIHMKQIDTNKFSLEDDNEPFVSLQMKNIPSEDLESTVTSDNEVAISEISDEGLNSQDMDLINNYFQNGKTVNTVGIKISEIKDLKYESDSSFNSEVQHIFNPHSKDNVDEGGTDSEIENLPIDMQIEILENKSISSLDNDSINEDNQKSFLNNNKDKYSLELEKTLDTALNTETKSDSLKTLYQSPDEQVQKPELVEETSNAQSDETENLVSNEIIRQEDIPETNLSSKNDSPTNPNNEITDDKDRNVDNLVKEESTSDDPVLEKETVEEVTEVTPVTKETNNNDEENKVENLETIKTCDKEISRSKSSENVSGSNGKLKSPHLEKLSDSPTPVQTKPSNGFGKCCSSSSSSNLDLCSEGSSKSSNQCRDLTPVRRRRSLPESPVKALSLTNMCAGLTRPEGTSYNMIAIIFVLLALYILYARGLHIVTLLAFISLACIFFS